MGLFSRIARVLKAAPTASTVGTRRPSSTPRSEAAQEDRLRARLVADPNDARSFGALAEIVRRRAAEEPSRSPLAAPADPDERQRAADLAMWSLAEELAGSPKAWFPLIELARLSVDDDREGALRRLGTAAERDPSGKALSEGIAVLREAGLPGEALGLGVGHWRVREQDPSIGRQLVLAAIEAERPAEARAHLDALALHPNDAAVRALLAELEADVARAERAL
jgi:hypothetical protein